MKQKVVIKVSIKCEKCRRRALKVAVSAPGVTFAEIQGGDKNEIVVTGEGIDSTCLTMSLRKKLGFAEIVSVTPIPEKKEGKKETKSTEVQYPIVWAPPHHYQFGMRQAYCYEELRDRHQDPCTIM